MTFVRWERATAANGGRGDVNFTLNDREKSLKWVFDPRVNSRASVSADLRILADAKDRDFTVSRRYSR